MIIDGHTHFGPLDAGHSLDDLYEKMLLDMKDSGIDQFAVAVPERMGEKRYLYKMAEALWLKNRHPDKVYVFGGLRFDFDASGALAGAPEALWEQLRELMAIGCDGLKLLIGKPDSRKILGVPLDSPLFGPLFSELEKTGFPVVWHISDPPEFWDPTATPLWARRNNWWYDATHPSFDQIRGEAERVFARHPKLNLVLAHFYFLSKDLKAAAAFLDGHPNICLDTAPGVEMCHNFTDDYENARAFCERYADRIVFGTDVGMDNHGTSLRRARFVRQWLENDGVIPVPEDDPCMMPDTRDKVRGLNLSRAALDKIFAGNFQRIVGAKAPRPLDIPATRRFCQGLLEISGGADATAARLLKEI